MPHATEVEDNESATIPQRAEASPQDDSHILNDIINLDRDFSVAAQDVQAQLHYLSPAVEFNKNNPPIQVVTRESTTRDPRTTVRISQGPQETIRDVRGREHEFTLERNGFKYVRNRPRFQDWESRDGIWIEYIEELKELVACEFGGIEGGVDEVIAFHEGVRTLTQAVPTSLWADINNRSVDRTKNGNKQLMANAQIHLPAKFMSINLSRPFARSSKRKLISKATGFGRVESDRSMPGAHSIIRYTTAVSAWRMP